MLNNIQYRCSITGNPSDIENFHTELTEAEELTMGNTKVVDYWVSDEVEDGECYFNFQLRHDKDADQWLTSVCKKYPSLVFHIDLATEEGYARRGVFRDGDWCEVEDKTDDQDFINEVWGYEDSVGL